MRARAEVERATHQRIVDAAVRIHETRGIAATSWDDLAEGAGVNRATVYRHFRDLRELIPACARQAFEAIDLPSRAIIEAQLADLTDSRQRLERVVRESCACYERGAGWLRAAWREADLIPELADVTRRIRDGVATLLDVALLDRRLEARTRAALIVLAGYPFWQQLIDGGVARDEAPGVISDLMERLVWPKGGPR